MEKHRKPKEYTHIDYEALLIYAMKKHVSIEKAISDFELNIARSTVVRSMNRIIKKDPENEIINLYKNEYVPNMQKEQMPDDVKEKIDKLEDRKVVKKVELEDLYKKLSYMKEVANNCGGNLSEATRVINSGRTPLGNVRISRQGFEKNLMYYDEVKKEYENQIRENNKETEERGR